MLKVGWFSTARGESSRKLLQAAFESITSGLLNAEISFVFCSRDAGESENTDKFFQQVISYGLPLTRLSVKRFAEKHSQRVGVKDEKLPEWRLAYDRKVIELLKTYEVDLCVLAGYMLIVGPEMCCKYNMINLHPALPTGPKGTWQEVIWELIKQGADQSGVMIHLVTPELDRGPVITYCGYNIKGPEFEEGWRQIENIALERIKAEQGENNGLFKKIRQSGFIRETPLIIYTLKSFSEGKIRINLDKKLVDEHNNPLPGYDLTTEIDRAISNY